MSQRMTRSRKRKIEEENFENFGIVVDEFGCIAEDYCPKSLKPATNKKNEDEEAWDSNYVVEIKRQRRDESPESNPVYYRKILTSATVHRSDLNKCTTPPRTTVITPTDEEKIEMELLDTGCEPNEAKPVEVSTQELLEIEENDDTASDTTDKVAEDLKVLLEETKESSVPGASPTDFSNGISSETFHEGTPAEQIIKTSIETNVVSSPIKLKLETLSVVPKPQIDFDKIDIVSSELILECVDA